MNTVFLLTLIVGGAFGLAINNNKYYCERECSSCGGVGLLKGNICECHVTVPAKEAWECIAAIQKSSDHNYSLMGLPSTFSKRSRRSIEKSQGRRRVPRQVIYDVGLNDFSSEFNNDGYSWERAYRSPVINPDYSAKTNVYEVYIGDDEEDSLQFIFPDSDGIEIEHQYFIEGENGREYPLSGPLQEPEFPRSMDHESPWDDPGQRDHWNDVNGYSKTGWSEESKQKDNSWTYRGGKGETLPEKWEANGYSSNRL